jgi:hypothetical protein
MVKLVRENRLAWYQSRDLGFNSISPGFYVCTTTIAFVGL